MVVTVQQLLEDSRLKYPRDKGSRLKVIRDGPEFAGLGYLLRFSLRRPRGRGGRAGCGLLNCAVPNDRQARACGHGKRWDSRLLIVEPVTVTYPVAAPSTGRLAMIPVGNPRLLPASSPCLIFAPSLTPSPAVEALVGSVPMIASAVSVKPSPSVSALSSGTRTQFGTLNAVPLAEVRNSVIPTVRLCGSNT